MSLRETRSSTKTTNPKAKHGVDLVQGNTQSPKQSTRGRVSGNGLKTTVRCSTSALTFGIEFEFVLAFHDRALLDTEVFRNSQISILKDCDYDIQQRLVSHEQAAGNGAYAFRSLWPSWVPRVPLNDETRAKKADRQVYVLDPDSQAWIRRYAIEPLLVAKAAFSRLLPVNVIAWMDDGPAQKQATTNDPDPDRTSFGTHGKDVQLRTMKPDYTKWTLTNDYTVVPVRRRELHDRLKQRGRAAEFPQWDSYGVELITPIMDFHQVNAHFADIEARFSALTNQEYTDTFENVWASTHVHIGFNKAVKEDISFPFFQHVAFILVNYEPEVTRCFPRRCCGVEVKITEPSPPMDSSLARESKVMKAAREDNAVQYAEAHYTGSDDVRSNREHLQQWLQGEFYSDKQSHEIGWVEFRDHIFSETDNLIQIIRWLQKAADDDDWEGQRHRGYMVNWCNIYTIWTQERCFKTFKPTLEFRQHPCTTDAAIIKHWVLLLEAIMKVAGQKVHQRTQHGSSLPLDMRRSYAEQEGSKYPNDGRPFGTIREYVTRFLELDESEGTYWEARYDKYKNDRPAGDVGRI